MTVFSCWNKADLEAGEYTMRSLFFFRFSEESTILCMCFKRQSCKMRETRAASTSSPAPLSCLSHLAPSVTLVVTGMSHVFRSMD